MSKKIKSILIQNVSFLDWSLKCFANLSKYDIFQRKIKLAAILHFSNRKIKWLPFEYQNVKIIRK